MWRRLRKLLIGFPEIHEARQQIFILRRKCFLSYRDISTAANASVRSIQNCEKYDILVAQARVRVDYLYGICHLLYEIMDRQSIRKWLREPKEIFDGKSPLQLIKEGRAEEVKKILNELLNDSFS